MAELLADGSKVVIENKGHDELPIGGYVLKCMSGMKEVTFKFPSRQHIKAHKTITVRDHS